MDGSHNNAVAELEHLLTLPPLSMPPTQQSQTQNNPVAVAHAVLQELRDSGDPHRLFLRCVLQLTAASNGSAGIEGNKEELFFHCASGCRQAVLWQWGTGYSREFLRLLRNYFVSLGHRLAAASNPTTTRTTCRIACYTAAVAFWKRGWNDDENHQEGGDGQHQHVRPEEEALAHAMVEAMQHHDQQQGQALLALNDRQSFFRYLESDLFPQHPECASTLCACLVGEFGAKSTGVSYRLPLEFHKEAHRSFEKTALLPILQLGMTAFGHTISRITSEAPNNNVSPELLRQARSVVQLLGDALGWEFGMAAFSTFGAGAASSARTLIRPPVEWKDTVARVDVVRALFEVHPIVVGIQRQQHQSQQSQQHAAADLAHNLRQLLLQFASLSGPMFLHPDEKKRYASTLLEGTLKLLEETTTSTSNNGNGNNNAMEEKSDLLDALQLISRIIANFRLALLVELPALVPLLQGATATGQKLLTDQRDDCHRAGGDLDCMDHREWREEALVLLLECAVLLCGDPWILYSGTEETRKSAQMSLSGVLGPLYEGFVQCRTRMAAMEEHYAVSHEADVDETREAILETDLEEELSSIATVGRLNLSAAIACLSNHFGQTMPALQSLWEGTGEVAPHTAALLEESRLLTMYICHLLTDNNEGESPTIPDAVVMACQDNAGVVGDVSGAVHALLKFAESQVQKIAENPANRRLSPLLGRSFLWFLNRWAPAYVYPTDYGPSNASNKIVLEWSTPEKAQQVVAACVSLCLHYQCYWPHEPQVQEAAGQLLMSLAKRGGPIRSVMVASPVFHEMVRFHCLTAAIAHSATHAEFEAAVRTKVGNGALTSSLNMVWGYQRLPYQDKARVLTSILVACSDTTDAAANAMITDSLKVIHDSFTSLVNAIATKQVSSEDVNAKEMACLCVEMFCGVAHASEMSEPERIPRFVTPYLSQLSGLMACYGKDLTICEALLRFFRDYTEQFVSMLDRNQSLALFHGSAELLKSYSAHHCEQRVIKKKSAAEAEAEEEQAYGDILCAIQLLINLGAKDFIDACSSAEGVNSSQVTDMIFFGLQHILPLMTQGLLQFPHLCSQFFDLVGFMLETYPDKVCVLPYDLFNSLLESLLFGMSHLSSTVFKPSLQGIASIAKEHLKSNILAPQLAERPDIFDKVSRRLLMEVVFQNVVVDRVEAAGMALLPLVAVDVDRFAVVVQELSSQVGDEQQRLRLQAAFHKLIKPEALAKVAEGGYEGRMIRARFKADFEEFVSEVHSFLVLR